MRSVNVSPMHDGPHFCLGFLVKSQHLCGVRHFARNILLLAAFFYCFPPQLFFLCSSATENRTTTILVETFLLPQSFPKSFPDPLEKKRIFTLLPTPTSKALTFTLEHT